MEVTTNLELAVNLGVMGLRERNAARTREMIIDTALSLFLSRGYEATKMEDVAEAAGIGTSTLYRYFPTKDLLVIDPLAFRGKLAEGLRARPAEESIEVALGRTMLELFTQHGEMLSVCAGCGPWWTAPPDRGCVSLRSSSRSAPCLSR